MNNRRFAPRVAVCSRSGDPVRYVPSAVAHALVSGGNAEARQGQGRIREVTLTTPASSYAQRIGPASPPMIGGTKFTRTVRRDDSGRRILEHHPRSFVLPGSW